MKKFKDKNYKIQEVEDYLQKQGIDFTNLDSKILDLLGEDSETEHTLKPRDREWRKNYKNYKENRKGFKNRTNFRRS